ncbi:MAG: Rpn family recombination-promoting nuclease/putative transposase [Clostridiales bacterium]|nr:Rpn family recombination-promoting nuclease/putative transposase [Clostridiales bacterium]
MDACARHHYVVKLADGTQMDFEMQVVAFDYWENRIIFYLSKMCTEQLKKGELYEKMKKCIHVSILNFIHFPEDDRCYRTISFCDRETGELYSDLMEIKMLELKKLQKDISEHGGVYDWMRFFSGKSRKEFEDMAHTDEYIGEACEELKKLSADERKRLEYEAREKAIRDYNSQVKSYYDRGREEGREEGWEEGRTEGREEERERINSLILKLAELGRTDDITRAAADNAYQEKLLREFGL